MACAGSSPPSKAFGRSSRCAFDLLRTVILGANAVPLHQAMKALAFDAGALGRLPDVALHLDQDRDDVSAARRARSSTTASRYESGRIAGTLGFVRERRESATSALRGESECSSVQHACPTTIQRSRASVKRHGECDSLGYSRVHGSKPSLFICAG